MKNLFSIIIFAVLSATLNAAPLQGQRVTGPIVPSDSTDTYPTHYDTYGSGGYRSVADELEKEAIPSGRRVAGMLVHVRSTGAIYLLGTNLTTWTATSIGTNDVATQLLDRVRKVNSRSDLGSLVPLADGEVVLVSKFSTNAAWGSIRSFVYEEGSNLPSVDGCVEDSGSGQWVAPDCFGGGPVDVRWFGAFPNDEIDDTAAFQAAANLQTNQQGSVLTGPAGRYNIGSVVFREGILDGGVHVREQGYGFYGFVLVQNVGATNHMLRAIADGTYRGYQFRNVTLEGRANANLRSPKAITAVTDRFNFTVSTGDLPANGGTNTVYPYYGHVFFYTSENKYAGFGIVSNINFSTGVCTLLDNTDLYATLASATNGLLTVGWKACFSPSVTETSDQGSITRIDPFSAGYAGISFEGQGGVNYEGGADSVNIRGFHAGIRLGPVVGHRIHHTWTKMNSFAGIGTAFSGKSYDLSMGDIQTQGFYEDSYPEVPETLALTNRLYRYTGYGLYGIDTTGQINDVTADHDVIGMYLPWNSDTIFGQVHIEGPSLHGIWFDGSFWGGVASQGPERTHGTIQTLNVRSHSSLLNNPPMPNTPGRKRYAIYGAYQNNAGYAPRWRIDNLNVGDHTLNTVPSNRFDAIFHADNSNVRISVGHLDTRSGATNIYSSATQTRFTPIALGYAEEGRYKLDAQFDEMLGGASADQYRTDNATKQFRMLGVRYDTDSQEYGSLLGFFDDGSERYWQVGWGATNRPPPTFFQFYGADSYAGAEELWAQWDNSILKFYGDQFQIRSPQFFMMDGTNLSLVKISSGAEKALYLGTEPTFGGGGGGSTNGSSVYVEGTYRDPVNLADTADLDWTYSGTNANGVLKTTAVTPGSYTLMSGTVDSKGRLTAASSGSVSLDGLSDVATNGSTVGQVLARQPDGTFAFTNQTGGGGSSSNSSVLVNGAVVSNPNFTNTDANIVLSVANATNVQVNLSTNPTVAEINAGTLYVTNAIGVDSGGSGRSTLTTGAYLAGNGTNPVTQVGPTANSLAGWNGTTPSVVTAGSGISISGGFISSSGGSIAADGTTTTNLVSGWFGKWSTTSSQSTLLPQEVQTSLSASWTPAFDQGMSHEVTMTNNLTLSAPSGVTSDMVGHVFRLVLIQDSTGNRSVTSATNYLFGADITGIYPSTNAGNRTYYSVYVRRTNVFDVIAESRGYSQ
jgi:hypothetical protein